MFICSLRLSAHEGRAVVLFVTLVLSTVSDTQQMISNYLHEIINLYCLRNIIFLCQWETFTLFNKQDQVQNVLDVNCGHGREDSFISSFIGGQCISYFLILDNRAQAEEITVMSPTYFYLKALVVSKYHPSPLRLVSISICQNESVYHGVEA